MSEKNSQTDEDKEYWEFVERTARDVRETPKWMGGDAADDATLAGAEEPTKPSKKRNAA